MELQGPSGEREKRHLMEKGVVDKRNSKGVDGGAGRESDCACLKIPSKRP